MLIDAKTVTGAVVPTLGWMGKDSQSPDFGQKVEESKGLFVNHGRSGNHSVSKSSVLKKWL